jgi:hypothetical protein
MKKILLTVVMSMVAMITNAQTFMGLPLSGSMKDFHEAFTQKGFTVFQEVTDAKFYKGQLGGTNIEVLVLCTPTTKQVAKAVIFFPEIDNFLQLELDFYKKKKILEDKYGKAEDCFEYFVKPYYRGDGYEMTALSVEKYINSCFWKNMENLTLAADIHKNGCVRYIYENITNMTLLQTEKKQGISDGL